MPQPQLVPASFHGCGHPAVSSVQPYPAHGRPTGALYGDVIMWGWAAHLPVT